MSTHTYVLALPPTRDQLDRLNAEANAAGRPISLIDVSDRTVTIYFTPDLSPAEVTVLNNIMRANQTNLSRAERDGIQADIDLLVTFQGIATPTLVQTAAATKAQSRVLRAILRS